MKKFLITLFLLTFYLAPAGALLAAESMQFIPNVPIPGGGSSEYKGITREEGIDVSGGSGIAKYIQAFYVYSLGALGIFATTMIMWGGLKWIVAGGNSSDISAAKSIITNAVFGLCLGLLSYVILFTVNPALVQLSPPVLKKIASAKLDFCAPPQDLLSCGTRVNPNDPSTTVCDPQSANYQECCTKNDAKGCCVGKRCDAGKSCFLESTGDAKCAIGSLNGSITCSTGACPDGTAYIKLVCNKSEGGIFTSGGINPGLSGTVGVDLTSKSSDYIFSAIMAGQPEQNCAMYDGVKGFYIDIEINDSPGLDDRFAIGKDCNKPISKTDAPSGINWNTIDASKLFSLSDINNTFKCDLNITRAEFPSR